jgi:23S rRNA (adenine-N6)-dimethyltransferase
VSAAKRTPRDERRRRLGQNFLQPDVAEALVEQADFGPDDLVIEIGPGRGACTYALARRGLRVVAVEKDPHWADTLRRELARRRLAGHVSVVRADALRYRLPRRQRPFRVLSSLPFGATTAFLHHLLDDASGSGLQRADLVVQWEVARKRTAVPPTSMLSASWAPWWTFELGPRLDAISFRPVPAVDAAVLRVRRRTPPLLPEHMANGYAAFVRGQWK